MAVPDDKLTLKIESPFGADFLLHSLDGTEDMSGLFSFTLTCHDKRANLKPEKIIGEGVTFSVLRQNQEWRHFHGIVASFTPIDDGSGQPVYSLSVVPWLWCLTLTSDFRVYQDKDVKEILTDVFDRHSFPDFEFKLSAPHPKREYCVQYNETAFNFVSRLLESEGIFYYFRHEEGQHVLVMGDSTDAYEAAADAEAAYRTAGDADLLTGWTRTNSLTMESFTGTDYDYVNADVTLEKESDTFNRFDRARVLKAYSFPAFTVDPAAVQSLVDHDKEMSVVASETLNGGGCARSFSPGLTFTMKDHPDDTEKGKSYVLTQVSHYASAGRQRGGTGGGGMRYENNFSCVPDALAVRPLRRSPVPFVRGVETAVVTGPKGEEIHTDKMGRIAVQFHWDRLGKKDEKSSCWVRVAQSVAGNGWGAFVCPRVGQEVVVSFVNGSPDRPLVTGVVYNSMNAVPYSLPDEKTKTVFRTRSTPSGSEGNEFTFDDKKGGESILLHGERDLIVTVKNDEKSIIDNEWHLTVKKDAFETVEGSRAKTVKKDDSETIEGNAEQTVSGDSKRSIEKSETVAVTKDYALKAKTIELEADSTLTLKVGGSSIEMSASGIVVKAPKIELKADAAASVAAPKVDVKADAMLTLDGGVVMIG